MICRLEDLERSISGRPSRRSFLQGAGSLLAVAADWRGRKILVHGRHSSNRSYLQHVYAAIAQTTPVVNGNSAIIVTKQGLVIVDSQSSPSAAHSLYNQFKREVADLPVRYVIGPVSRAFRISALVWRSVRASSCIQVPASTKIVSRLANEYVRTLLFGNGR